MKNSLLVTMAAGMLSVAQPIHAADLSSIKTPIDNILPDGPITWNGLTLYGVIDVGGQWASHGLPFYGPYSAPYSVVTRSGNHAMWLLAPNNMSLSTIGLKGDIPIFEGWRAVFDLSTGFDPVTGQLMDTLNSLVHQNGHVLAISENADTTRAGQAFNGNAYIGIANATYGELVFGRVLSLFGDNIAKYDITPGSYAYSLIGLVGGPCGAGNTEDCRLDQTLKYRIAYGPVHFGALYKFANEYNNSGYQLNVGGKWGNFDIDGAFGQMNSSLSAAFLNPTQMTTATQTLNTGVATTIHGYFGTTLAGTISDNTSFQIAAKYKLDRLQVVGGYEWINYADPKTNVLSGYKTIGGYIISSVNNANFLYHNKILQVFWTGAKYAVTDRLDWGASFYRFSQNSYGATYCNNTSNFKCAGYLNFVSTFLDYHLTRHFDLYGGVTYSTAGNGLAPSSAAAPYLYRTLWAPTAGVRFTF